MATVDDFFAPDGLIARVKPDFAPREGQAAFSELITQAITERKDVIAELPTGSGKSYAALVPSILAAVQQNKRVVISTETLNLQSQYMLQDVPLLQKACLDAGIEFTYAVAKGRTNFICRSLLDEQSFAGTSRMMAWAKEQCIGIDSGDLASIPFPFSMEEWRHIAADEDCERSACPFYGEGRKGVSDCFVYEASRKFLAAQIVVANHTLVLLDLANEAGSILGHYDLLVVDEAHVFAEKARDVWGTTLKPRTVSNTIKLLARMLDRVGVSYFASGYLDRFRELEDKVFTPFKAVLGQSITLKQLPPGIVETSKAHSQVLIDDLRKANRDLSDYVVRQETDPQTIVVRACKERLSKLVSDLGAVYGENIDDQYKDNWLVFLETGYTSKREPYGILNLKPIEVAPLMRHLIYDAVPTTVFMSATMRIGPSFGFMRRELGISDDVLEFIGSSPFNFEENVTGYFPTHLPDNQASNYLSSLAAEVQHVLDHTKGRGLVLFTNNTAMRYCYEQATKKGKHRCFLQGQASKPALIEAFKADVSSCLFATRSFFTGVDIPGEALSCVILTKAPFTVPTEPIFKARCDRVDEAGGSSFNTVAMPLMLFDIRQAFGRLIRTTEDTGLFAFLDSRAMKKAYGKRIISALPNIRITGNLENAGQRAQIKNYSELTRPEADPPSPEVLRLTASLEED